MLTIFIVTFVIFVFVALIHSLFAKIYHYPRLRAVSERLKVYDSSLIASRNDRIKKMREKFAVNLGSLPTVKFRSIDDRSKRSNDERDIDDGYDADVELEKERRLRRDKCLSTGLYLSEFDDFLDCRSLCHVSDGVEYKYFHSPGKIINGSSSRAGSYCLPTDASLCNENTSLLVYGKSNWRCLTISRAFSGEGGNKIVVCNGSLLDRATGVVWRDSISPNLKFSHIDELLPLEFGVNVDGSYKNVDEVKDNVETEESSASIDSSAVVVPSRVSNDEKLSLTKSRERVKLGEPLYRFVCPPDTVDRLGNRHVVSPFDRLHLLDNYCASLVPGLGSYVRPDFANSTCICRESDSQPDLVTDPLSQRCIPRFDAFDSRAFTLSLQDSDCVETWSVRSGLFKDESRVINVESAKSLEKNLDFPTMISPCGVSRENSSDTTYPRLRRTRIPLFDRVVMSHLALREVTVD